MVEEKEGEGCIYKEMEEVVGIYGSVIWGICGYIWSCNLGDLSLYVWHVSNGTYPTVKTYYGKVLERVMTALVVEDTGIGSRTLKDSGGLELPSQHMYQNTSHQINNNKLQM